MNWQDKGYLLSLNKYNENSSIAEFYTENNGKIVGVIFGSTSKKNQSGEVVQRFKKHTGNHSSFRREVQS